jgi:hypothetical protein
MLGCYVGSATTAASGVPSRFLSGNGLKDTGRTLSPEVDKSTTVEDGDHNMKQPLSAEGEKQADANDAMDIDQ